MKHMREYTIVTGYKLIGRFASRTEFSFPGKVNRRFITRLAKRRGLKGIQVRVALRYVPNR